MTHICNMPAHINIETFNIFNGIPLLWMAKWVVNDETLFCHYLSLVVLRNPKKYVTFYQNMAHICHMPTHKNIETFNNVALQYIKKNIWSSPPWKEGKKFWNPYSLGWWVYNPQTIDGIGCVSHVNVHTGQIQIGWLNRPSQDQGWNSWPKFDGVELINTIWSLPTAAWKDKGILDSIDNWSDWMCVRCWCAY